VRIEHHKGMKAALEIASGVWSASVIDFDSASTNGKRPLIHIMGPFFSGCVKPLGRRQFPLG
jgi:hypothetical protein